jgi:hypothetical protein
VHVFLRAELEMTVTLPAFIALKLFMMAGFEPASGLFVPGNRPSVWLVVSEVSANMQRCVVICGTPHVAPDVLIKR